MELYLYWELIRKSQNLIYLSKRSSKGREIRILLKKGTGRKSLFFFPALSSSEPSMSQLFISFSYKLYFSMAILARAEKQLSPLEKLGAQCVHALVHLTLQAHFYHLPDPCSTGILILALVLFLIFHWAQGDPGGTGDFSKLHRKVAELCTKIHS